MEKEKISIIIPIYNVEQYLERCIDSVLCQTYKNLEIILVDDGSPDSCGTICDTYAKKDDRIKVIHKESSGVSDARNRGLNIATGDYIGFVDSDDYISEDMFKTLYELLKTYKADISTVSFYEMFNGKVIGVRNSNNLEIMNKEEALKELYRDDKIQSYCWNKLFKRELFEGIRFPSGKNFEDIAIMLLLFERSNIVVRFEKPEYYYMRRNSSIVGKRNFKTYNDYIDVIIDKYFYMFGKYPRIELYNAYNFVINAIWLYTIIVNFNIEELYDKYESVYKLLMSLVEKYGDELQKELDEYNKAILYLMMLDKETSKSAIKEIYSKFKEKRDKGEFNKQI